MADMECSEVVSQIATDSETKNMPIVFLTAIMTKKEELSLNGNPLGGYPFIAKSITTGDIINCIEKNLKKQ